VHHCCHSYTGAADHKALLLYLQVTTLLLQLLFEPSFKKGFLPVMMRHYTHLLHTWFADSHTAGPPLDMITVQLFNDMVCAWWVTKQHSMTTLFIKLHAAIRGV